MTAASVAGVYAQALLGYAQDGGHRDAVVESCRDLVGTGRQGGALSQALISQLDDPRLGKDKAKQALAAALEGRVEGELSRLLMLLIDKNRLVLPRTPRRSWPRSCASPTSKPAASRSRP